MFVLGLTGVLGIGGGSITQACAGSTEQVRLRTRALSFRTVVMSCLVSAIGLLAPSKILNLTSLLSCLKVQHERSQLALALSLTLTLKL